MTQDFEKHLYSKHLYDTTRREIAIQLMEKEISKQLQSVDPGDVKSWMSTLDDNAFWNSIEGHLGGALLKPIVHFLTAENYTWSKREVLLEDIQFSTSLPQLDSIEELNTQPPLLKEIEEYLEKNPSERDAQLSITASFNHGASQDEYPVLIVKKGSVPMVMDGNRRVLQALLKGHSTITAWYCETNGEQPRNYWYPVDDMMRLVSIYTASKDTNASARQIMKDALLLIFSQSTVARKAYDERIVKAGKPGAKELLD